MRAVPRVAVRDGAAALGKNGRRCHPGDGHEVFRAERGAARTLNAGVGDFRDRPDRAVEAPDNRRGVRRQLRTEVRCGLRHRAVGGERNRTLRQVGDRRRGIRHNVGFRHRINARADVRVSAIEIVGPNDEAIGVDAQSRKIAKDAIAGRQCRAREPGRRVGRVRAGNQNSIVAGLVDADFHGKPSPAGGVVLRHPRVRRQPWPPLADAS